MSVPRITILICTRNRQEQLTRCLKSILKLKYPSFELMIVDNGSSRFSAPRLEYPCRTRIFSHPVPGLSRARNSVLIHAEGDLIALMDDDAVADEEWLNAAALHFNDQSVGCVTGKIVPLETRTQWQERQIEKGLVSVSDTPRIFDASNYDPLTSAPGTGSNIILRRDFIKSIGFSELFGPGTPVFAGDEHYLFYQIIRAGWKIHYEPAAVVYHDYVETEEQFRNRMFRMMVSRGALLTMFGLLETGCRLHTVKHLFRKLLSKGNKEGMVIPRAAKIKGLLWGPFALLASALQQRKDRGSSLLFEINPESSTVTADDVSVQT